jgi:outer membrane usher protein
MQAPGPRPNTAELEPLVLTLVLNATTLAEAQLMHRETGPGPNRVWLPEPKARAWRMNTLARPQRVIEGVLHAAFCEGRDQCDYDEAGALLTLQMAVDDLLPLRVGPEATAQAMAAPPPGVGAYLNYDLSAWHIGRPGIAGLIEGRAYSAWGHGALRLAGVVSAGRGRRTLAQAVWQVDEPALRRSWQIGSIAIPDTALGAGLPVHGVRLGTNTRLQPLQTDTLRPQIDGQALRSTRADVFVDGLFRQTAQVPYGPYSIEVQPQFAGRGEIDLVSTDVRGVQSRVTMPYYQAPQMLQPGASAWSVDIGRLAQETRQVGGASPWLASGAWRQGLGPQLTGQAQLLVAPQTVRLGISADHVQAQLGLSSASAVWQRTATRPQGQLWLGLGHELMTRQWFASLRTEHVGGRCGDVATADPVSDRLARPCQRTALSLGGALGPRWSGSAGLDRLRDASGRHTALASLNARLQVGARSQLGLGWSRLALAGRSMSALSLTWSQPLGQGHVGQIGVQRQHDGRLAAQWSAESMPGLEGVSTTDRWRVYGRAGQRPSVGAGWTGRAAYADWRADAWADTKGGGGSASVSGAVGVVEGRVFAARRINDAFVLVDVGVPDLPVLLDNREVARTNAAGWAIVTEARAHQANNVGVDTASLPVRYAMPLDQQTVVPSTSAGVLAQFDVSDGGLAVAVRDAEGRRLPAGALVQVSTQRLPTAVTSRSEVFLERSDRAAQIDITWAGQRCSFQYTPAAATGQAEPQEGHRCLAP